MEMIVSHLDVTQIFCEVDDFYSQFEQLWQQQPQLPSMQGEKRICSRLHLSEVMTIVIAFPSNTSMYLCLMDSPKGEGTRILALFSLGRRAGDEGKSYGSGLTQE